MKSTPLLTVFLALAIATPNAYSAGCSSNSYTGGDQNDNNDNDDSDPVVELFDKPTATISADKNDVRTDAVPILTWSINYPPNNPPIDDGIIITPTEVRVDVYMLGAAISNYTDWSVTEIQFGEGAEWETVYAGLGVSKTSGNGQNTTVISEAIDGSEVLLSRVCPADTVISLRAQGYKSGTGTSNSWLSTDVENTHESLALVMVNGDEPSSIQGWGGDESLEEMVDITTDENGFIELDERDILVAFELTHTSTSNSGFDLNDSIALVRFVDIEDDSEE